MAVGHVKWFNPEKGFGFHPPGERRGRVRALLAISGRASGRSKRARRSSSRSPRVPRVCRPPTSPNCVRPTRLAVIVRPGSSGSRGFFVSAPDDHVS